MRMRALKLSLAVAILAAATWFTVHGSWPWRRLHVAAPIVVTRAFTQSADTLRRGETISSLLARQGIYDLDLAKVASAIRLDPRRLRAGLVFNFRRSLADSAPGEITVRADAERRIRFYRAGYNWNAEAVPIAWHTELVRVAGRIDNSLYAALDEQVSDDVLPVEQRMQLAWELADVFAWQVDFTRDIQPGDRFQVLIERRTSEEGEVRFGRVLAGDLSVNGRTLTAFAFEQDGRTSFYDADGNSLRRAFLRAPVQFRRISSNFSRSRYHPVLGIWRRHAGTDYAASPGTPVMAAGDGVVQSAGWSGGYGRLVEIRHRNGIVTRYGHLQSFAPGVRRGVHVSQGQTVGYVGSSGLATGPHLHYEFRVNGAPVDPRSVDPGGGEPIRERDRAAFERERDRLRALLSPPPLPAAALTAE